MLSKSTCSNVSTLLASGCNAKEITILFVPGTFWGGSGVDSGMPSWLRPWLLKVALIHPMSRSLLSMESCFCFALKRCRLAVFSCSQTRHSASSCSAWQTSRWAQTTSRTKEASWVSTACIPVNWLIILPKLFTYIMHLWALVGISHVNFIQKCVTCLVMLALGKKCVQCIFGL